MATLTSKHLERALHLKNTRPEMAAKEIRLAIAEDPENAYLHAFLASCALDYGAREEALSEAQSAIRCDPTEPYGFYVLSHYYFQCGNVLEAEVTIEDALKLDSFNPSYWGLLANIQIEQKEYEEALHSANEGLRHDPRHVHCHNLRGLILTRMGKTDAAKDSIATALASAPENALSHTYTGWTLLDQRQYDKSREHFREALRIDPTLEWARHGLIKALQSKRWTYRWHDRMNKRLSIVIAAVWFALSFWLHDLKSHAPLDMQTVYLVLSSISWLGLFVFLSFTLLPAGLILEPVSRFLLQFDPDGKYVLTPDEQRLNKHAILFLAIGLVSVAVICTGGPWWPLQAVFCLYIGTLPFAYPDANRKNWKVWAGHLGASALFILCFSYGASTGHPAYGLRGFYYLWLAKYLMVPAAMKTGVSISLMKVFGSAAGIKGLGAVFGLGGAGAYKAIKEKKKELIREKMLKDASTNSPKK